MKCCIVFMCVVVAASYGAPSSDPVLSPVDANHSGPTVNRRVRQFFDDTNTNVDVSQQSGSFQDFGFGGGVSDSFQNTDIDISQQNAGGIF